MLILFLVALAAVMLALGARLYQPVPIGPGVEYFAPSSSWARFRLPICALAFGFLFVLAPTLSFAQEEVVAPAIVDGGEYVLSPQLWKLLTAIALPVVIALLTKVRARPVVVGAISIVVSFLDALVVRAVKLPDGAAVFSQAMIEDVVYIYAIQFLSYFGVYKLPEVNLRNRKFVGPNIGLA